MATDHMSQRDDPSAVYMQAVQAIVKQAVSQIDAIQLTSAMKDVFIRHVKENDIELFSINVPHLRDHMVGRVRQQSRESDDGDGEPNVNYGDGELNVNYGDGDDSEEPYGTLGSIIGTTLKLASARQKSHPSHAPNNGADALFKDAPATQPTTGLHHSAPPPMRHHGSDSSSDEGLGDLVRHALQVAQTNATGVVPSSSHTRATV